MLLNQARSFGIISNTSEESIKDIELLGWKLVCRVPRVLMLQKKLLGQMFLHRLRISKNYWFECIVCESHGLLYGRQNSGVFI